MFSLSKKMDQRSTTPVLTARLDRLVKALPEGRNAEGERVERARQATDVYRPDIARFLGADVWPRFETLSARKGMDPLGHLISWCVVMGAGLSDCLGMTGEGDGAQFQSTPCTRPEA